MKSALLVAALFLCVPVSAQPVLRSDTLQLPRDYRTGPVRTVQASLFEQVPWQESGGRQPAQGPVQRSAHPGTVGDRPARRRQADPNPLP